MNFSLNKYISFSILFITILSINFWSSIPIGGIFFWWGLEAFLLIAFVRGKSFYYDLSDDKDIRIIKFYFFWNVVCIVRGIFIAENYWEWKQLAENGLVALLPLSIYIYTNVIVLQKIIFVWIKYALPAFFLFYFIFISGDAIGAFLAPISLLLLFFPILTNKWKVIVLFFTLIVIMQGMDSRSNIIKFVVPFLLSLLYYLRSFLSLRLFEIARLLLMFAPIILFLLGVLGVFNIFNIDEYVSGDYTTKTVVNGELTQESLTADTRTMLYVEELASSIKYNYILFGRTPARGYESPSFGYFFMQELHTQNMERVSSEVSILNIFNWTGLVGVILYFLLFFKATYLAINKSNNIIIKIVGICVAFRWTYAWVEDFSSFNLSLLFLWAMIGMCFSNSFRQMSDQEMQQWIKGLFNKKYQQIDTENQY